MFLTQIKLNPSRRGTIRLLESTQRIHAAVLAGFPDVPEGGEGRILWRYDDEARHKQIIYVLSPVKPDYTHMWEKYGWVNLDYSESVKTADYEPLLQRLGNGDEWFFRLEANPTRRITLENGKRIRKPLQDGEVEEWLHDVSSRNGFTVKDVMSESRKDVFRRRSGKVTLGKTVFSGLLQVDDVDDFRKAMVNGIGPAKGYGCGLITLAKR